MILKVVACIVTGMIMTLSLVSVAQQTNPLIRLEESFQFDKLRSYLQMVEQQGGKTPAAHYLKALLSEDASEALQVYQTVIAEDSLGIYTDRALWRIAQYYYIKGEFQQSYTVLLDLVDKCPQSPIVPKARDQMERIATVVAPPAKTVQPTKQQAVAMRPSSTSSSPVPQPPERGKFTIQTGAFSSMENAQFMQNYLKKQGFADVFISKRQVAGKLFFVVWVGSYLTQDEAEKEGDRLKKKIRNLEITIKPLP